MPHSFLLRLALLAGPCAGVLPLPAAAQIGNPAGTVALTPETRPGEPAAQSLNAQDRLFIQLLTTGNAMEAAAGTLAGERAAGDAVKAFARRMVQDHRDAQQRLSTIAREAGVTPLEKPDPGQQAQRAQLESFSGRQFDAAYLRAQLVDHQKTVQLLQWEMGNGQNPALQRYAAQTLPAVVTHLQMVQQLLTDHAGVGPQGLARHGMLSKDIPMHTAATGDGARP